LIINGSTAEMSGSFMLQFAQAMGSGVLQGDEFRAMLESNSFFANLLAKSLNTNIAGLRQMSKAGELTAAKLRDAFPGMAEEINKQFSQIPPTTARAMTALENAFFKIIDDSNKAADGTGTIATEILELAQTIDQNRAGIISLFTDIIFLSSKVVGWVGDIGSEIAVIKAVGEGRLGFFEYLSKDMKEMNTWLKENSIEISRLDGKLSQLRDKQSQIASSGFYTKEGIAAKREALAVVAAQIAALEKEKLALAGLATVSKSTRDAMAANDARHYGKTTAAAEKSAKEQEAATKKALDAMQKKYQGYADEVKRLQQSIADRESSLTDKLRAMGRSVMSDKSAWVDRKKEAEELASAAKKAEKASKDAFAAGNETLGLSKGAEAVKLYEKAGDVAEDLLLLALSNRTKK
jgi:tape measure domain-containing protein